jgi:hypothetical protein
MQAKPRARLRQPKADKQSNLLPLTHFIEHLATVSKKPPQEHGENKENSSLGFSDSRTKLASTYNYQQSDTAGTATKKKQGRKEQLGSKSSPGPRASRSPAAPTKAQEPEAELRW